MPGKSLMGTFNPILLRIILVMVGGGLGSVSRYGVSLLAADLFGTRFPWGTLFVNLTGCFLIGFIFSLGERTTLVSPSLRLFFMTGVLGGLTTFSTFALETVNSARATMSFTAAANFLSNNVLGAALVFLGMWVARLI